MYKSIPYLLCLLLLSSCEKDIKIDLPAPAPKLVMNAVVLPFNPVQVHLSRTMSVMESGGMVSSGIGGALVVLLEDGKAVDTLRADFGDISSYFGNYIPQQGRSYVLQASAAGYDPVEAAAVVPQPVPITSMTWQTAARQSSTNGTLDALELSFMDPEAGGDHYIVSIIPAYNSGNPTEFYDWGGCAFTSDASIESASSSDPFTAEQCISAGALFMTDALFNGKEKKLRVYTSGILQPQPDHSGNMRYAQVFLYHVSEDFYKYLRSFLTARETEDNPFAEPFNVRGNVKGGYGIFAVLQADGREVR